MLVSLETAKQHLRVDAADEDALITLYIEAASSSILAYLKEGADAWLDSAGDPYEDSAGDIIGLPVAVKQACLLMVGIFYRDRESSIDGAAKWEPGYLPAAVTSLLYPFRDPALR